MTGSTTSLGTKTGTDASMTTTTMASSTTWTSAPRAPLGPRSTNSVARRSSIRTEPTRGNETEGNTTGTNETNDPPSNTSDVDDNASVEGGSGNETPPGTKRPSTTGRATPPPSRTRPASSMEAPTAPPTKRSRRTPAEENDPTVDTGGAPDDDDLDGVVNILDLCAGTPVDVEVDATGCAVQIDIPEGGRHP